MMIKIRRKYIKEVMIGCMLKEMDLREMKINHLLKIPADIRGLGRSLPGQVPGPDPGLEKDLGCL